MLDEGCRVAELQPSTLVALDAVLPATTGIVAAQATTTPKFAFVDSRVIQGARELFEFRPTTALVAPDALGGGRAAA